MFPIDWKYISSKKPEEGKLGNGNQRPKIEFARAFMRVPITSYFDNDSMKHERASMWRPFFY